MPLASNPKRSGPTSSPADDIVNVISRIAEQVEALEQAAVRGLPNGYRFEVDDVGPLVRDATTGQVARLSWEDS